MLEETVQPISGAAAPVTQSCARRLPPAFTNSRAAAPADMITALVRVVWGIAGTVTVLGVLSSAVRTVILPRGVPARFSRLVFVAAEAVFRAGTGHRRAGRSQDRLARYRPVDRRYAAIGPFYLMLLLVSWLVMEAVGFTGLIEACQPQPLAHAAALSGSALTTLGVITTSGLVTLIAIAEAGVGLIIVALLITYLPALYSAFSRREATVAMLSVRGGVPAHGPQLLAQQYQADHLRSAPALFTDWATWFVELAESHTSFPVLV